MLNRVLVVAGIFALLTGCQSASEKSTEAQAKPKTQTEADTAFQKAEAEAIAREKEAGADSSIDLNDPLQKRLAQLAVQVRDTHKISQADFDFLLATVEDPKLTPKVASYALTHFTTLKATDFTEQQREKLYAVLERHLKEDDTKTDPEGYFKTLCTSVVWQAFPEPRFVPLLQPLLNDTRSVVRGSAEEALAAIRKGSRR